ncbi:protein-L-isoaspartate O-methyltransferase family protein [Kaarinaea lacus]
MATHKNTEQARFNMIVQQIRPAEVLDDHVLNAMTEIPREEFVPERFKDLAFSDINIDIGHGEIMMKPIMEARLLQALQVKHTDNVLEIGTGSGYFTALLARMGSHVDSVEIEPEFIKQAQDRLTKQRIKNVSLIEGDAAQGWKEGGPYDVIAITGSIPILPEIFQQQLAVGGRMVVITGTSPVMETLLITREADDQWDRKSLFETDFPALRNVEQPQAFIF